jgi:DNA replication and repair protein RecF
LKFLSLKLTNFKGYENLSVDFHPKVNCIVGNNGMGKTNLLDALYYSCFTKSYFVSNDLFICKEGSSFFRIEGVIEDDGNHQKFAVKMPINGKKLLEINSVELTRRLDYLGKFTGVMIAPDDNQIILGASELRRKFISSCISQYRLGYLNVLLPYQNLIKQRNAALKQFQKKGKVDLVLLDTLDDRLIEFGNLIFSHRKEYMKLFLPIFNHYHQFLVGDKEVVSLEYESQLNEVRMEIGLNQSRQKDLITARSNFGPHKDDLKFLIHGQPLKSVGSQGQQKSFLVALKLAQYSLIKMQTQKAPFLFLDDLFDKFDQSRLDKLIELVRTEEIGQVFITDTHPKRIVDLLTQNAINYQLMTIDKGMLSYG